MADYKQSVNPFKSGYLVQGFHFSLAVFDASLDCAVVSGVTVSDQSQRILDI